MKSLYTILLFLIFSLQFSTTQAQSVRVFSKTGLLKGTYSTIKAALATTTDGDSMILSAHTFYESKINANSYDFIIYQGTILGKDTTTIDAGGNGACFINCVGTIRDIIITGARATAPSGLGNYGSGILRFNGGGYPFRYGRITGNTIIRNNDGGNAGGLIAQNSIIDGNVKIVNNSCVGVGKRIGATNNYAFETGGIIGINVTIAGQVEISGNKGGFAGAISSGLSSSSIDTAVKLPYKIELKDNVKINDNEGDSAIFYVHYGIHLSVSGAQITKNKKAFYGIFYLPRVTPQGIYDTTINPRLTIDYTRLYNPKPDGSRIPEVYLSKCTKGSIRFNSKGCWWGYSDTTALIRTDSGSRLMIDNWAVANWYGKPFSAAGTAVSAQMQLNTGAALPPNCFKGLEGKFTATAGSFPSPTSVINAGNLIASDYYYPASGPFAITASVDADTFRANNKGALGIKEPGYTSVKVFPNPTTDELHISNLPAGITLHIFDASGRIVMQRGYLDAQPELVIPVADWATGVYTINLYNQQDQLGTVKFVKK